MTLRTWNLWHVLGLAYGIVFAGCSGDQISTTITGGLLASGGVPGLTGGDLTTGGQDLTTTGGLVGATGGDSTTGGVLGTGAMMGSTGGTVSDTGGVNDAGIDAGSTGGTMAGSTFPAAAYGDLDGSFTPASIENTGPGGGYNVYYPQELGMDGVLHPVLTWGNGASTTPALYSLLPDLASHGFVIVASTNTFVDGDMLKAGLDWMLEQNTASGSQFEGKLDPNMVGAFGYSLGSLATFAIGTDPRLKTTVHISGGIMSSGDETQVTALDNPTAFFCDADETAANCDTDFAVVDDTPTFYGTSPGVHVDYVLNVTFIERFNSAVIAWMRWQLMNDQTMAKVFEGSSCTLCSDSNWTIQKKNIP